MGKFIAFLKDDSGATAIEYGLMAALIALGITVGATALGTALSKFFSAVATKLGTLSPV